MYVGGSTYQPTIVLSGNRYPLIFNATSSNTSVATVSDPGTGNPRNLTVTSVTSGITTITLTYTDGNLTAIDTFVITVYGKLTLCIVCPSVLIFFKRYNPEFVCFCFLQIV